MLVNTEIKQALVSVPRDLTNTIRVYPALAG